jgi:hypothetical protein
MYTFRLLIPLLTEIKRELRGKIGPVKTLFCCLFSWDIFDWGKGREGGVSLQHLHYFSLVLGAVGERQSIFELRFVLGMYDGVVGSRSGCLCLFLGML